MKRKRAEQKEAAERLAHLASQHRNAELAFDPEDSAILSVPRWRRDAVLERERFLRKMYRGAA